jgi:hypothetical protein
MKPHILKVWAMVFLCAGLGTLLPTCASAQEDARTKQLRLLCAQISGDLTEPGGIAAFRRCLTAHDPTAAMKENAFPGGARGGTAQNPLQNLVPGAMPQDRVGAAPPRGYGRDGRKQISASIAQLDALNDSLLFAVGTDGKLYRYVTATKQATVVTADAAQVALLADGAIMVLGSDGTLWRMNPDGSARTAVGHGVAGFQSVDASTLYVLGRDQILTRFINGRPALVDKTVAAFQAADAGSIAVLGTDGKLWNETGDFTHRTLLARQVAAFQIFPGGLYLLATDRTLWRRNDAQSPEQIDHDISAFRAVDMTLVYVVGTDGRLWQERGDRAHAVLVDTGMAVDGPHAAIHVIDPQHLYLIDAQHQLWAEVMPPG